MFEFAKYVVVSFEEYPYLRGRGLIDTGSLVDHHIQPLVVGLYSRKPVFAYRTDEEKTALINGDIEGYYALRGVTKYGLVPTDEGA